jgi:sodium-coupled neutral amino acid transporter 11
MLTTLPLECFVCREVLETYFFAGEFDRNRHLIFTSSLVVSAMIISLLTCDLGIVLELTGGLSATALAFIFPSICYLKLTSETGKRVPTADLPALSSSSWSDEAEPRGPVHVTGPPIEEHETLIGGQTVRAGRNFGPDQAIRSHQYDLDDEESEVALGRSEHELGMPPTQRHSVDVEDVELPLQPGANVRFRPAAANRKWWQSTRPLSVMCAIFGTIVLVISGEYMRGTNVS